MRAILFIGNYDVATEVSIIIKSVYPEAGIFYATQYLALTQECPIGNIEYCLENHQLVENFWTKILSTDEATVIVSDLVLNHSDKLMAGVLTSEYNSFGNRLLFNPLSYILNYRRHLDNLGILFVSRYKNLKRNWKSHLNGLDLNNVYSDFTTTEGLYDNPSEIGSIFKRLVGWIE